MTGYYSGPLWAYRTAMLFGAAIVLPAAGALVASAPSAPAAVIGFVLVCGGLALLWLWWLLRDKRNGRARRIQILGACLTLATVALFETALVLFLGRAPRFTEFPGSARFSSLTASRTVDGGPRPGWCPGGARCGARCAGQTWLLISPATRSPEATAALRVMLSTSVCSPAKWTRPSWTAS